MNFIKMIFQYAIRSAIALVLTTTLFVTNLFWPAASEAIAQALPVQTNQPQSNQSSVTGILQLASADIPSNLKYSKDHIWVRVEGNIATLGITEFQSDEAGAVTEVVLPEVGKVVDEGSRFGTLESVSTLVDFYAPLKGEIVEVNQAISGSPELVSDDPYGKGWLVKIKFSDSSVLNALLSDQKYNEFIKKSFEA